MEKVNNKRSILLLLAVGLSLTAVMMPAIAPAQTIRKVSLPDGCAYSGWPIVFRNNLYIQVSTRSGAYQLAAYGDSGRTRLIPNPDDSKHGYMGYPVIFKDKLYMEYQNAVGHFQLGQFDGASLVLVPSPAQGFGMQCLPTFAPILYDARLYFPFMTDTSRSLGCFDGTSITLLSMRYLTYGVSYWTPFVYHNKLYFPLHHGRPYLPYHYEFPGDGLAQFDGKGFTEVSAPDKTDHGYQGGPVEYKEQLYFSYYSAGKELKLARLDGTGIHLVPSPDSADLSPYDNDWRPIMLNNKLYLLYATKVYTKHASPITKLGEFDGLKVRLIANPPESYYGIAHTVAPVEYNHRLYMQLYVETVSRLGVFDGKSLQLVPDPPGMRGNYEGSPVVYKDRLYFKYGSRLAEYDGSSISFIGNDQDQHQSEGVPLFVYKDRLFVFINGGLAYLEREGGDGGKSGGGGNGGDGGKSGK